MNMSILTGILVCAFVYVIREAIADPANQKEYDYK